MVLSEFQKKLYFFQVIKILIFSIFAHTFSIFYHTLEKNHINVSKENIPEITPQFLCEPQKNEE